MDAETHGREPLSHLEEFEALIEKQLADRNKQDMLAVLSTPEGRRFVWSILASAGVYQRAFAGDPCLTAFNEGSREVGIRLLERVEADARGSYLIMQQEQMNEISLVENARQIAMDQDEAEGEL